MATSFENQKDLEFELCINGDESDGPIKNKSKSFDKVIFKGMRASVQLENAGQGQFTKMNCRIWGISKDTMYAFTTMRLISNLLNPNSVAVYAIDGKERTLVFAGNMMSVLSDFNSQPNVSMTIFAQVDYTKAITPGIARGFKGEWSIATIFEQLAKEMGKAFENNGVNGKVRDISLRGSVPDMIKDLARMSGIGYAFEGGNLAIWPKNGSRKQFSHKVSAQTGLVGYPTFDGTKISFKMLFNANIVVGSMVEIYDDYVFGSNGKFYIQKVTHLLDSNMPGGAWFSLVEATTPQNSILTG